MKRIFILFALLSAFALPVQMAEANSFTSFDNLFEQIKSITGKNPSFLPVLPNNDTKFDIAVMFATDSYDPFAGAGKNLSGFNVLAQATLNDFKNSVSIIEAMYVSAGNAVAYEYDGASVNLSGGTIFVSALVDNTNYVFAITPTGSFNAVPVPAAVVLFGTGVAGIVAMRRKLR